MSSDYFSLKTSLWMALVVGLILFLPFSAHAQDADWVGFKKVEKTGLDFVPFVQAVTYRTISFGMANNISQYKILDTNKQKITKSKKKLDSDYNSLQIETCRRYKLKKCPVSNLAAQATSIIEDGNTVHSCRHAHHNWLFLASKHNSININALKPPMLIINHKNKIVYNSAYSPESYKITFVNNASRLNIFYTSDYEAKNRRFNVYMNITDYMIMNFDNIIVPAQKIIRSEFPATSFYVSGYPIKTNFYGGTKKGDAPGDTLVMTSGTMIKFLPETNKYEVTNATSGGMSGGIALDKYGEMLGITCGGDRTGSVVLNTDIPKLLAVWSYIERLALD